MKALTWHGKGDMRCEEVPEPMIEDGRDAIRDGQALQAKLDELIFASTRAENRFIGIEKLDEAELRELRKLIDEKCPRNEDCVEEIADEMSGTGLRATRAH